MSLLIVSQLPPPLQAPVLGVATAAAASFVGRRLEDTFGTRDDVVSVVSQVALLVLAFYYLRIFLLKITGVDPGTLGVATVVFASFTFNSQPTLVPRFRKALGLR